MATQVHESRSPRNGKTKRIRLTVDISPEMRRRIKMAAAQRDLSVRDYVVRILDEAVPSMPKATQAQQGVTPEAVERLLKTSREIMAGRRFTDDSTDLLREAREERTAQL
jgi:uncharacterized protein (DUF1778 family)